MRGVAWGGALAFFASLIYFLFSYFVAYAAVAPAGGDDGAAAVAINVALFSAFALHHSVFARARVRAWVSRLVPAQLERSIYVWIASALFVIVCALWQPVPGVAWTLTGPAAWAAAAAQAAGVWLTVRSASMLDVLELAGVRQVAGAPRPLVFRAEGPYGWVRHPIYSGWFLLVFFAPVMTMTRLTFAVISSVYLLLAIPLEERSLRAAARDAYEDYMRRVRWKLVPGLYGLAAFAYACGGSAPAPPTAPTPAVILPPGGPCGTLGMFGPAAILNGTGCSAAASAVVLLNARDRDGFAAGACSGTIVAPRRILTAAHCLTDAAVLRVWLGAGDQIAAASWTSHPEYRGSGASPMDVGVVVMAADLPRAPIPLLLSRDARVGEAAVIAGWGRDQSDVPSTLRAGVTNITGVTPTHLETVFAANLSSVCSGDSGGPIMVSQDGVWTIAGVISATSQNVCNTGTNYYVNLRNPAISSFVLSQVPEAGRR